VRQLLEAPHSQSRLRDSDCLESPETNRPGATSSQGRQAPSKGLPLQDTIAVVFDFDETLAPDSTSSFLDSLGIDVKGFWTREVQPLLDSGWDPVPAYLYMMIEKSRAGGPDTLITQSQLTAWGKKLRVYEGATRVFDRLKAAATSVDASVSVEFYLVSSGLGEILRATKIPNTSQQFGHVTSTTMP
jgi:hypothetical protein